MYSYSNDIAGYVAERISGKPLNIFVKEALLKPLNMSDTDFYVPAEKSTRLSNFYESVNGNLVLREAAVGSKFLALPHALSAGGGWETGYGGMVSTAQDYGRLLQMLLNRGELNGVRILKPETVQELITDQIRNIPTNVGARFPPDIDVPGRGFGLGSGTETEQSDPKNPVIFWSGFPYNVMYFADFHLNMYGILFTQSSPFETEFQPGGLKPEFRTLVQKAVRRE